MTHAHSTLIAPPDDAAMNPASEIMKEMNRHMAIASEVVRAYISRHYERDEHYNLIIDPKWKNEKGYQTIAFLAAFSQFAHDAAAKDKARTFVQQDKTEKNIQTAMEILLEHLDHGMPATKLAVLTKNFRRNPKLQKPEDANRIALYSTLTGPEKYFAIPDSDIPGTNLRELITAASQVVSLQQPESHVARLLGLKRGSQAIE